MKRINKEEYEVLKPKLEEEYTHVGKSRDGKLQFLQGYIERDMKREEWSDGWGQTYMRPVNLFQFIHWEDEEPYNIAELIEEYESEEMTYFDRKLISEYECLTKESEETEVKTKQELIEKWESAIDSAEFYGKGKEERLISYMKDFVSDLNQLDEPETLSEYWIEQKLIDTHVDTLNGEIQVTFRLDDLQNLLVPKQEELDRAYRKGFKEGERQTAEYFESITEEPSKEQVWKYLSEHGIEVVDKEPETVASVIADFYKSLERLKEVLGTEVKEMEE